MAKSTKTGYWTWSNLLFPFLFSSQILINQTVAVVGKQVLTLHDVTCDLLFNQPLETKKMTAARKVVFSDEQLEKGRQSLVRKTLISNYLKSVGLEIELAPVEITAIRKEFESKFSSRDQVASYLALNDMTEVDLSERIADGIRSRLFMDKHLPVRVTLSDQEVREYYEKEKERRFLSKPFESVQELVRINLRTEKIRNEFDKWLESEMRRTEVIFLPLGPFQKEPAK